MKLYCDSKCESLDELRVSIFKKNLNKRGLVQKKVDPRQLPPSSPAAAYHSLRVYCQVQEWLGNNLNPLSYGWKLQTNAFTPLTTDLPIAPINIMRKISCHYKSDCKSGNCSCRRLSLFCTEDCRCSNDDCANQKQMECDENDDEMLGHISDEFTLTFSFE